MLVNNIMFTVRQSNHQSSHFKFSNNLFGKVYNNHRFLNSCSYLEADIKLSTSGNDYEHNKIRSQKRVGLQDTANSEAMRASHRKYSHSAKENRQNRYNRSPQQYSLPKNPLMSNKKESLKFKVELLPDKIQNKKLKILKNEHFFTNQVANPKIQREKSLKPKHAFNPTMDNYFSQYVYIRIIDRIRDLSELEQKSIKVNFQKIYKKLIKTQLMGEYTTNFMETIEKYIREIVKSDEMYLNHFDIELQPQLKTISRKEDFLERLIMLWDKGQTLKIHELVKYYCIPAQETSNRIIQELVNDLVIEIYEKKSCNRNIEYVLMTQDGKIITHISQIYFSTLCLLIVPKETAQKEYLRYHHLIQEHNKSLKMTMRQSIRHSFVGKIVKDRLDDNKMNYHEDPHNYSLTRREAVQKAAAMIQSNSKLRLNARKEKNEIQSKSQKFLDQKPVIQTKDNLYRNYLMRKRRQRIQYNQILQKLRIILDPNHAYEIKSNLHDSTQEQFRKLRLFNDKYDITYNYNNQSSNKILLINMIQNCDIFNKKTTEQLQKLLKMLKSIYGKGQDNINQISYCQFQEIYQTAHGVANQDVIIKFALNYLSFDQYGEIKKQDFFQIMDICLSQRGRSQRIIKFIIWSYFEKMSMIQNNALRKKNLQICYQPIKIVYMLLLSVIFGCEYDSIQQMINDILRQDYQ